MQLAVRLTIVVCLLGAAGAIAPVARAATYTVWSCRGPAAEPVPATAWEGGEHRVADDCAQGGALSVVADRRDGADRRLRAPQDAEIVGYRIWRSAAVDGWGSYATLLEQPFDGPVGGCFAAAGCAVTGDRSTPLSAANLVERSGVHLRALAIAVGCHWHCRHGDADAELRLYRSAVDITDTTPPVAVGAPSHAAGSITVPAHDAGGGLRSAQALIDGRPVATTGSGCAEPYSRLQPCPADVTFTLALDTAALADGAHSLTVDVTDAAGNTATLLSEPLAVQNAQPAPSVAPAPPGDHRLIVGKRRFVAGASAAITGQVMRGASAEPGASVLVERRWYGARGGGWRPAATLTTDARGAFALRVPAKAQQVRFRLAQAAASPPVDVVSRLQLSVRVRPATLRNGEAVVLSGRLAGAGPAARGERVRIQAMVSGRWKDVGRATADSGGRFRWRYRFRNTHLEALYSFRARVTDASARWPWPALSSRRVKVHVIP